MSIFFSFLSFFLSLYLSLFFFLLWMRMESIFSLKPDVVSFVAIMSLLAWNLFLRYLTGAFSPFSPLLFNSAVDFCSFVCEERSFNNLLIVTTLSKRKTTFNTSLSFFFQKKNSIINWWIKMKFETLLCMIFSQKDL